MSKEATTIDMPRMKVVSIIGRLRHYPKPLTADMREQAARVIEEYLGRDSALIKTGVDLIATYDAAMAAHPVDARDLKLAVMANYGDIALSLLRAIAKERGLLP